MLRKNRTPASLERHEHRAAETLSLEELMSLLREPEDVSNAASNVASSAASASAAAELDATVDFFFESQDEEREQTQDGDMVYPSDLPLPPRPQNIEEELEYLDNLIRVVYPDKINALEKFRSVLSSREMSLYFDADDIKWVTEDLDRQKEELARIEASWSKTSSVYRDTYLRLKETIEMRQLVLNALDKETNIFMQRPQLIDRFAEKQAKLSTLMDECCEKIRAEQKEVQARVEAEQREMQAIIDSVSGSASAAVSGSASAAVSGSASAAVSGSATRHKKKASSSTGKKKKKVRFIDEETDTITRGHGDAAAIASSKHGRHDRRRY